MDDKTNESTPAVEAGQETLLNLGTWLGRHQTFGLIANQCSAGDAECLKILRENEEYKKLGLTGEEFCIGHAGVSRSYADRLIHYLEEFGTNYFRLAELMQISAETYRLVADSVGDAGMEVNGETIPDPIAQTAGKSWPRCGSQAKPTRNRNVSGSQRSPGRASGSTRFSQRRGLLPARRCSAPS